MTDDCEVDPDASLERFVARWLRRYFPNETDAVLSDTESNVPIVDRLRTLFCSEVVKHFGAQHHSECADKPERWIDVVTGTLLLGTDTMKIGPAEMLLALLPLEHCNWTAVEKELKHSASQLGGEQDKPQRRLLAVIGVDPISGERVEYTSVKLACASHGLKTAAMYKAIANGSKLQGMEWSYTAPPEQNEQQTSEAEIVDNECTV